VFFNSIAGRILDASTGLTGHQHFYLMLVGFSTLGLITTILLSYFAKSNTQEHAQK
jgi:hypothetical protein